MKTHFLAVLLVGTLALVGCVNTPTRNYAIPLSEAARKVDVLEIVIDVAKSANLPPVTKLDKANGLVEFGNFGMPELGFAAQVRIRSDHTLDVTIKRTSLYAPSLATGMNYFASLPLGPGRVVPALKHPLNVTDDYFSYNDRFHFINSLMIIIESVDSPIEPASEGAFRVSSEGRQSSSVEFRSLQGARLSQKSLVARWERVGPGEQLGVIYRFRPKTSP